VKVLLVTHDFLPRHRAGVEIHAFQTALGLRERGLEVRVFTTEKALAHREGTLLEDRFEGIPVIRMVRNRMFRSFRETWDFPPAEAAFGKVLAAFRPEAVHFHHLLYLSLSLPRAAAEAGIPVIFTLHDYWLQCRLMGQRLDPWGEVCMEVDSKRCGACLLASPPEGAGPLKRLASRLMTGVRSLTGVDLGPAARRAGLLLGGLGRQGKPRPPDFPPERLEEARSRIEERWRAVKERVVPPTKIFLSPSRFLLEEMAGFGIPREKLRLFRLGVERLRIPREPRRGKVRFAFFGTVAPHKGVHVLLEAFRGLSGKADLVIHGGAPYHPSYGRRIAELCREVGARWTGAYRPAELPRLLGRCDCLVVPSIWLENSPLTILQARAAGIPSVVSGMGGMAELVARGGGWTFPPGDAGALHALLEELAGCPGRIEEAGAQAPPVPDVEQNVRELADLYASLSGPPPGKEEG